MTSVYLVLDAHLSGAQLVLIGVAQAATGLAFEVPAGAIADAVSRRWSLIASHLLMGTAMLATGLVTSYPALVATQMLWGLSWNLASGAESGLDHRRAGRPAADRGCAGALRPGAADRRGRRAGGGGRPARTQRSTAMIAAGTGMLGLAGLVAVRFPERRFARARSRRLSASAGRLPGRIPGGAANPQT